VSLGLNPKNVYAVDSKGVIHTGREGSIVSKARYAQATDARTLADVMPSVPIFSSDCPRRACSSRKWSRTWRANPLILAMANPDPEICPEDAKAVRPDVIIGTGRSDYPNQVNNVCAFPSCSVARWTSARQPSTKR
jgi:malate dehydrogenase (oxaloacetate-decarboxylating)(NADP+)